MPLVILLHAYTGDGLSQERYFDLQPLAEERGFLYVHPDGVLDGSGYRGWNATDACCGDSDADDTAYLNFIIDEVSAAYSVIATRIYLVGHSNGGFMAHRMACDHADRIAAIVSLAGATFLDRAKCAPTEPVSVLQIHGTADERIRYDGGFRESAFYPGAETTVAIWSTFNGCSPATGLLGTMDLDAKLAGDETTREEFKDCPGDGAVELWTIREGGHGPPLSSNFAADIVEWLFSHRKAFEVEWLFAHPNN